LFKKKLSFLKKKKKLKSGNKKKKKGTKLICGGIAHSPFPAAERETQSKLM